MRRGRGRRNATRSLLEVGRISIKENARRHRLMGLGDDKTGQDRATLMPQICRPVLAVRVRKNVAEMRIHPPLSQVPRPLSFVISRATPSSLSLTRSLKRGTDKRPPTASPSPRLLLSPPLSHFVPWEGATLPQIFCPGIIPPLRPSH